MIMVLSDRAATWLSVTTPSNLVILVSHSRRGGQGGARGQAAARGLGDVGGQAGGAGRQAGRVRVVGWSGRGSGGRSRLLVVADGLA
jgi:hypothetical protein